jgi:transglutaminase-like putative cysteine protease
MPLFIRHATTYIYDPPADRCALRLRLYPPSFEGQSVTSWQVSVNGTAVPALLATAFGDRESLWVSTTAIGQVEIVAEGVVETADLSGVVRGLREISRPGVFRRTTPLTAPDKAIDQLATTIEGQSSLQKMHNLSAAVLEAIPYKPGATDARTTAAQALKLGAGVCQDHAHLFIAAARCMGIPARYVVGYLHTPASQMTETHAWAEVFLQELGWVGFDPANALCPTERYVRLGCGLDAADAAPIRGNVAGVQKESLAASVDISQTQQ